MLQRIHHLGRRALRTALDPALALAGRVYVPGPRLEHALAIARPLADARIACTLGYFHDGREGDLALARLNCDIVDALAVLQPPGYVSIKAPAFDHPADVVQAIVDHALGRGVLAHFDSHGIAMADATRACVAQAVARGARVGLTVPGRWPRSPADAAWAAALGVRVRVVKGEWADPGAPQHDARHGFLEVVERLAGRAGEVAIATHDASLARQALQRLQDSGTRCELELLHGLPRQALLALAHERGVPVRIYVPFGAAWRPYALGKLAQNPRMLWWLLRDSLAGLALRRPSRPALEPHQAPEASGRDGKN